VIRLVPAACAAALLLIGCGGGTKTVTKVETQGTSSTPTETTITATTATETTVTATAAAVPQPSPGGNHGPHHFETPSHNIGCFVSAHDARCDVREHSWSPPPEPRYCIKAGVDWGGGLVVGPHRAQFVCAGDTTLGGPAVLGYGHTTQRGSIVCASARAGMTCSNGANGHGFFVSRDSYRLF
jgi:Family of unknown function (DUF6636)